MSTMGKTRTITSVLDKSLDKGPLKPINKLGIIKYYCPNCYSINLWYRQTEANPQATLFDITCLDCHKHWEKTINAKSIPKGNINP